MAGNIGWNAAPLERYIDSLPRRGKDMGERLANYLAERTSHWVAAVGAVDTGFLRDSPRVYPSGGYTWKVIVTADYAGYVNYGTYKMAARPFWEPAIEDARRRFPVTGRELLQP